MPISNQLAVRTARAANPTVLPTVLPSTAAIAIAPSPAPPEDVFTRGLDPRRMRSAQTDVYIGNGNDSYLPAASQGAEAGKPLVVHYLRNPSSIGVNEELSKLRFFSRVDGVDQPMQEFDVATGNTHDAYGAEFKVDVPDSATNKVEYWFEAETKSGARVWDSKGGENFSVPVVPQSTSTLRFDDLWGEQQSAAVKRGSSFEIAYDVDRLKNFLGDGWYMMGPTFYASAFVSFDGKPAQQFPLTNWVPDGKGGFDIAVAQPRVQVPVDASSVRIWFSASTEGDRAMYDSDFGKNYNFAVT